MSKKQKNLATTNKTDFTILASGDAFISQRKLSEITGIPQSTISDWIRKSPVTYIINEKNQLHAKSLQKFVLSGRDKNYHLCVDLLDLLLEAGAKAYIYHQAGYQFDAKPREELLKNKRLAQWTWSDALKFKREKIGKKTSNFHYSNENLMINQVILGERRAFKESEMSNAQVELVEKARTLNGSMIELDLTFQQRKAKLLAWFNGL